MLTPLKVHFDQLIQGAVPRPEDMLKSLL